MAQATVIASLEGDWVGVYADDDLVAEGHSLEPAEVLRAFVNAQIEDVTWDEVDLTRWGRCPTSLTMLRSLS